MSTLRKASAHRWDEMSLEPMNPMITRQYVSGGECMLARLVIQQGCTVPEHSHPNEQIAYILSGALEFTVAGEKILVREGGVLVIPPNVPHSAYALEDTVDLDVFAPPRQDWLDGTDTYLR